MSNFDKYMQKAIDARDKYLEKAAKYADKDPQKAANYEQKAQEAFEKYAMKAPGFKPKPEDCGCGGGGGGGGSTPDPDPSKVKVVTYSENNLTYQVSAYEFGGQFFAEIKVPEGFMDVKGLYLADDNFSGQSANLGGHANMNGTGVQWDAAFQVWMERIMFESLAEAGQSEQTVGQPGVGVFPRLGHSFANFRD